MQLFKFTFLLVVLFSLSGLSCVEYSINDDLSTVLGLYTNNESGLVSSAQLDFLFDGLGDDKDTLMEKESASGEVKDFECKICGVSVSGLDNLVSHALESHSTGKSSLRKRQRKVQCPLCPDEKFFRCERWGLLRHLRVDTGVDLIYCHKCGKGHEEACRG